MHAHVYPVMPIFSCLVVCFVSAIQEAQDWSIHIAVHGESLPTLSLLKSTTDIHGTLSSARPMLYIVMFFLHFCENLVLNHICSHCLKGDISNVALSYHLENKHRTLISLVRKTLNLE